MKSELTKIHLKRAVDCLASSQRGREALRDILSFICNGGDGLDTINQSAVITILRCQFGPFAGSTREEISRVVGKSEKKLKFISCGGCGADHPDKRCIGCNHQFTL